MTERWRGQYVRAEVGVASPSEPFCLVFNQVWFIFSQQLRFTDFAMLPFQLFTSLRTCNGLQQLDP